jgi:nitrate reductase assembly molybdenum cofactor insertion protein NarJ
MMRAAGVEESHELPDHLSHVLKLLGSVDAETAKGLCRRQVLPAVSRILAGFGEPGNPYQGVLEAVAEVLGAAYGPADALPASAFACPAPYGSSSGCPALDERDR